MVRDRMYMNRNGLIQVIRTSYEQAQAKTNLSKLIIILYVIICKLVAQRKTHLHMVRNARACISTQDLSKLLKKVSDKQTWS